MRVCCSIGSEIAHWLFWQKKTTGALNTLAQTNASLTSPWLVAPSPKYAMTACPCRVAADGAVALHAHRVAGGVQRLRADHDRVQVEVELVRVPAAVVDAAEQAEQEQRVDAAAPGDAVLAVGRERIVLRAQRAAGPDLRGLLAEQRRPDAELALPLQRGGLDVDAAGQDQVAVERAQLLRPRRRGRRSTRGARRARPRASAAWTRSGDCSGVVSGARRGGFSWSNRHVRLLAVRLPACGVSASGSGLPPGDRPNARGGRDDRSYGVTLTHGATRHPVRLCSC